MASPGETFRQESSSLRYTSELEMTKTAILAPAARPRYDVSVLTDQDIYLFNEGNHYRAHDKLGAHLIGEGDQRGACFSVWAPNAREVSVMGSFNGWDPH